MWFTAEKHGVLEMQNFISAYMKRVDVPAYKYEGTIVSESKFLGCIGKQIFLVMVLRCAR